ncbi:MAG: beta-phosphoglucomutase [Propionibacteriaceae bacterium]|jgi:beta-phosphoglucomutase|nr:beta-phosphoglucomutase [Propionibacteriaceae bacterium]
MTDPTTVPLEPTEPGEAGAQGAESNPYAAVIFDLDGVIVHTDELHYRAWKGLADRLGLPFSRTDNDQLRGVSRMRSLELLLAGRADSYSEAEKVALADEKNKDYRDLLNELSPDDVSEAVRCTLWALQEGGYRLAIGSSSRNAGLILRHIELDGWFEAVADGSMITHSKPDPEVFLKAAELLGLSPAECVIVEDARSGVDAALAGGFHCFGIGDAAGHPDVTWAIESLPDMLAVLLPGKPLPPIVY